MSLDVRKIANGVRDFFHRPSFPSPVQLDRPIDGALKDAEVLLAFAAQSRRSLKEEFVVRLTLSIEAIRNSSNLSSQATAKDKASFWLAYDELAAAMAPLSAHSIRYSTEINSKRFPATFFTSTTLFSVFAITIFLFSIVIQSFWVAGKDLLDKADALDSERESLQKQLTVAKDIKRQMDSKLDQAQKQLAQKDIGNESRVVKSELNNSKTLSVNEQSEIARLSLGLDMMKLEASEKLSIVEKLNLQITELNVRGRPLQSLLKLWYGRARAWCDWSKYTNFLCPVDKGDEDSDLESQRKDLLEAESKLKKFEDQKNDKLSSKNQNSEERKINSHLDIALIIRGFQMDREERKLSDIVNEKKQEFINAESSSQRKRAHEVRIILGNLASYIIPLAMGLLGALAFILQTFTSQLKEYSYEPIAVSGSVVRLCLGAIAGVFGGLAGPGSDAVLKGLPPLFIPFVFGYGIEILFSILNRIIQTFTQQDKLSNKMP